MKYAIFAFWGLCCVVGAASAIETDCVGPIRKHKELTAALQTESDALKRLIEALKRENREILSLAATQGMLAEKREKYIKTLEARLSIYETRGDDELEKITAKF